MFNQLFSFFEFSQIDPFTDWIGLFVVHNGIIAPMLLLLLEESGVPLPVPGEVYVAYAGYLVSKGQIPYIFALLVLLSSVLIGASILFYLSSRYGQIIVLRFGRYIHLDEHRLLIIEEKFRKYGIWVIIFGRHIPGFRVPITVFAGMSGISYKKFMLSTFVSVIFWIGFYLYIGQTLGIKVIKLLYGHHTLFLLLLIPFFIFVGSIISIRIHKMRRNKHKLA